MSQRSDVGLCGCHFSGTQAACISGRKGHQDTVALSPGALKPMPALGFSRKGASVPSLGLAGAMGQVQLPACSSTDEEVPVGDITAASCRILPAAE